MKERAAVKGGPAARLAARQFLLLSAYNAEGMQNLGFAYALLPVLEQVHRDPQALGRALERHLEPINTHPYMSAPLLGAVASLEADGRPEQAVRLKELASGPLAAMGDQFFWVGLKPAVALLVVAVLLAAEQSWAFVLFLGLYGLPQLVLRLVMARRALGRGRPVIAALTGLDLPRWASRVALVGGAAAAVVAVGAGHHLGGVAAVTALPAVALCAYLLVRRGVAPLLLLYLAAGLCLALAGLLPRGG